MVRRYEEPIEVRATREPMTGTPEAFVWRGRFYLVREVIDQWQERRAWWRDVIEEPDGERQVWRVAASPGRQAGVGVYDLGADGPADGVVDGASARWLLLRSHD